MRFSIKRLTKDLKDDYLQLFDNMLHKDNPEWSKCYCNDYHFIGDVDSCTHEMSRAMIIDRIDEEELNGYLVYEKDKPVGWANANNRSNYQRLLRDYDLNVDPSQKVCSVVCFLVHPDFRRQGITQLILEKVIEDYADAGYDFIEAYPKKTTCGETNFNGHFELFKRNNFEIHADHEKYYVMRRMLN